MANTTQPPHNNGNNPGLTKQEKDAADKAKAEAAAKAAEANDKAAADKDDTVAERNRKAQADKDDAEADARRKGKTKLDDEKGETFTYVGSGEDSPRRINFMGRQEFVRGKATKVTDLDVLAKIRGVHTFVEGEVDEDYIADIDEQGKDVADARRAEDRKINAAYSKKHKTE